MKAKGKLLERLYKLAGKVPFDDRINHFASLEDLDLGLIRSYLQRVGSSLFDESIKMQFSDLCRRMQIAKGPDEFLKPVNVGLLFFNSEPDKFFPQAQIDVVIHKDNEGRNFTENIFKGPLDKQLTEALDFIRVNVITEEILKLEDRPEAHRFYNYPLRALEEAIANAIYHKSYDERNPVEIQVFEDKITIVSYLGALPPVDEQIQKGKTIVPRTYRNRRIGDFLKELDLTEGRSTGIKVIQSAMQRNGSPLAIIETDQYYFLVTLPIHPDAKSHYVPQESHKISIPEINSLKDVDAFLEYLLNNFQNIENQSIEWLSDQVGVQVSVQVGVQVKKHQKTVLFYCQTAHSRKEILMDGLDMTNHIKNYKNNIEPLLKFGWINRTLPDKPKAPGQKYVLSEKGEILLSLLKIDE